MSYGNDALMPDQTYSSAPMDPGLDGLGFIHPESFNQPNTENHGKTITPRLAESLRDDVTTLVYVALQIDTKAKFKLLVIPEPAIRHVPSFH